MAEAEETAQAVAARRLAETDARARRQAETEARAERVDAKLVAMEDPDAEVFLEDGGGNGKGAAVLDGEGEVASPLVDSLFLLRSPISF